MHLQDIPDYFSTAALKYLHAGLLFPSTDPEYIHHWQQVKQHSHTGSSSAVYSAQHKKHTRAVTKLEL